jgi:site-specific recombinase XerD
VIVKGQRSENAVFSQKTAEPIGHWMKFRRKIAGKEVVELFVGVGGNTPGQTMTRNGIKKIFRDLGEAAGIGKFAPNDLRRSFATLAIRAGAPTRLVQVGGRWTRIEMVELYTQDLSLEDFKCYLPNRKHRHREQGQGGKYRRRRQGQGGAYRRRRMIL